MDSTNWKKGNFQVQSRVWLGLTNGRNNSNEAIQIVYKQLGYDIIVTSDYMKINDFGEVAKTLKEDGIKGLEKIQLKIGIPIRVMLGPKVDSAEEGFDIALNGTKGSRIYEKKADGDFEAHLVALSCSEPPEGFTRWSLRLLADKVVELDYIDSISHETIRRVLKKTKSNRGGKRDG